MFRPLFGHLQGGTRQEKSLVSSYTVDVRW